jgi:putative transcriptional regulator
LKENVWLACDADEALIFDDNHETKWSRALAKLGVAPERLSMQTGRA